MKYWDDKYWEGVNKPRIGILDWINVLKFADNSRKPSAMDIFKFINQMEEKTVTGLQLSEHFKVDVGAINLELSRFGREVIKFSKIPHQIGDSGDNRYWNIPFLNNRDKQEAQNVSFYWTLRPELIRALENIG